MEHLNLDAGDFIAVFALVISASAFIWSWYFSRKTEKKQLLSELLKEYREKEMGEALRSLWILYKQQGEDEEKLRKAYIENVKENKPIHYERRLASQYFQQLALYYNEGLLPINLIKKVWTVEDLSIIEKILYPLEKALEEYYEFSISNPKVEAMLELFKCLEKK